MEGIPDGFSNCPVACCYFGSWSEKDGSGKSAIDKAPGELMLGERAVNGRKVKASMIIVDSRSAENPDTAEINGHDGGKQISGAEIHIAAGVLGLPSAVGTAPANASDRSGALLIIGVRICGFEGFCRYRSSRTAEMQALTVRTELGSSLAASYGARNFVARGHLSIGERKRSNLV
ncbi:MAG: hypothetical protein LBU32_00170 [Clostridiales bacterium]|jgi:hypothetical protein|nr:hypothetical protein [Clostridiales bacterium]